MLRLAGLLSQLSMLGPRVCAGLAVCFLSLILACGNGLWSSPDYYADLIIPSCDSTELVKETRKDRQATDRGLSFFYEGYESSMGGSVVKLNKRECKGQDLILRMSITTFDLPEEAGATPIGASTINQSHPPKSRYLYRIVDTSSL